MKVQHCIDGIYQECS